MEDSLEQSLVLNVSIGDEKVKQQLPKLTQKQSQTKGAGQNLLPDSGWELESSMSYMYIDTVFIAGFRSREANAKCQDSRGRHIHCTCIYTCIYVVRLSDVQYTSCIYMYM